MKPSAILLNNASHQTTRELSKTLAARRLFGYLQDTFGGLPLDTAPHVIARNELRTDDLLQLMQHKVTALHVRSFFDQTTAREIGRELQAESLADGDRNWKISTSRGLESSDVATLGAHEPYNIVAAQKTAYDEYFAGVRRELAQRRWSPTTTTNLSKPRLWPLDLLRLQLDEVWPAGAGLARLDGRPFSGGLARIMKGPTRWRKGFIHVDEMGPLRPWNGLFSANIYLQMPDAANHENDFSNNNLNSPQPLLDIWPVGIRSRWDWYRNAMLLSGLSSQDPEDQANLRVALGPPITIAGEPGDLILICAQRPHAAVGFASGVRVSLQCFVQCDGKDKRLSIDN